MFSFNIHNAVKFFTLKEVVLFTCMNIFTNHMKKLVSINRNAVFS